MKPNTREKQVTNQWKQLKSRLSTHFLHLVLFEQSYQKKKKDYEKKMQKYRPLEIRKEQSLVDNKMLVPSKLATIVVTSMDREKSC